MPTLPAAELTAMQVEANTTMTDSCVIKRNSSPTADGFGSSVDNWATVTTVNGRMGTPTGGYIAAQAARLGELASWQIALPYGTDVKVNDQLTMNSQTLKVQAVHAPETYSVITRVLASEIR